MKIVILVEGATEKAFIERILLDFLKSRLQQRMPKIEPKKQDGRIPKEEKLKRDVENLLNGQDAYDAVIALTDVYTGTRDFKDAADAKDKMRKWVGVEYQSKFFPHVAQHEFEAWLLPYWSTIQKKAGHNRSAPGGSPEQVNHEKPPSYHIKEIFKLGNKRSYIKDRDALAILRGQDLMTAINLCPELKEFIKTILDLGGGDLIS